MPFLGGRERVRRTMANITVKLKVTDGLGSKSKDKIIDLIGKRLRKNLNAIRPIIENGINNGISEVNSNFIPTDSEAAELGIGQGGAVDRGRVDGAWKQLLVGSSDVTTFTMQKDTRRGKIANIEIVVNEAALFSAPLSVVETDDTDNIDDIPWMNWLIEGAPSISGFEFTHEIRFGFSRTGLGRMVTKEGGIWSFPPARIGAFVILINSIEKEVGIIAARDIGKVL